MTDICEFYGEAFIKARYAFLIGVLNTQIAGNILKRCWRSSSQRKLPAEVNHVTEILREN